MQPPCVENDCEIALLPVLDELVFPRSLDRLFSLTTLSPHPPSHLATSCSRIYASGLEYCLLRLESRSAHVDLNWGRWTSLVVHGTVGRLGIWVIRLNILALGEGLPDQGPEVALLVLMVRVAQEWHDGFGSFFGVVLRNATVAKFNVPKMFNERISDLREYVVDDVVISNVVHQMLATEAEIAVNGCSGTLQESPGLRFVLGDVGVGVVEVGDGDNPVVDPHIRHHVQKADSFPSNVLCCDVVGEDGQSKTDVRSQNEMPFLGTEERTGGREMAVS